MKESIKCAIVRLVATLWLIKWNLRALDGTHWGKTIEQLLIHIVQWLRKERAITIDLPVHSINWKFRQLSGWKELK